MQSLTLAIAAAGVALLIAILITRLFARTTYVLFCVPNLFPYWSLQGRNPCWLSSLSVAEGQTYIIQKQISSVLSKTSVLRSFQWHTVASGIRPQFLTLANMKSSLQLRHMIPNNSAVAKFSPYHDRSSSSFQDDTVALCSINFGIFIARLDN